MSVDTVTMRADPADPIGTNHGDLSGGANDRSLGQAYQNTTGRPMRVTVIGQNYRSSASVGGSTVGLSLGVGDTSAHAQQQTNVRSQQIYRGSSTQGVIGNDATVTGIVPPGWYYYVGQQMAGTGAAKDGLYWYEDPA